MSLILLKIALCLALTFEIAAQQSPLLSALVPKIDSENYKLQPEGNQYRLLIRDESGGQREEIVELRSPGTTEQELSVNGTLKTYYPALNGVLEVTYKAGAQGYVVSYKYYEIRFLALPPGALKSAAG